MEDLPLIYKKIQAGMQALRLTQKEIANDISGNQADVSEMVNGNRVRFSQDFLASLLRHGMCLDAIYDETVSVEAFRVICLTKKKPVYDTCQSCQAKDREIKLLSDNIEVQKELIQTLRKEKRMGG